MAFNGEAVGLELKVLRMRARMSQMDLAEATGIDYGSIARYETGKTVMGLDKAVLIAEALGCTISDFCPVPHARS